MTTTLAARIMPAQPCTESEPTTGTPGEGVKDVALFESREVRARTWDELSEIDRAVLLESVRQRRKAEERRRAIQAGLLGLRL